MCNVDIDDPIDLEEKTLDLKFRTSRLNNELMILRRVNGRIGPKRKNIVVSGNPAHSAAASKILSLEN